MDFSQEIAKQLIKIGAVGFMPDKPITYKSGMRAPIYVDNRRFPFHPLAWKKVIKGFKQLIVDNKLEFDVIAGIETAGIPHSATLGFALGKPSVFIRKKAKDHGTKKMVEGGDVLGKKVLLIEDHVTTGSSSLAGVESIRAEGGIVTACLSITNCEFPEAYQAFKKHKVKLFTLTSFTSIFAQAIKAEKINQNEVKVVKEWIKDPWAWTKTH